MFITLYVVHSLPAVLTQETAAIAICQLKAGLYAVGGSNGYDARGCPRSNQNRLLATIGVTPPPHQLTVAQLLVERAQWPLAWFELALAETAVYCGSAEEEEEKAGRAEVLAQIARCHGGLGDLEAARRAAAVALKLAPGCDAAAEAEALYRR